MCIKGIRVDKCGYLLSVTDVYKRQLTGCGGKDPVADTSASGETVTVGSEAAGTTGTADTFTYAIGGDPGANVNVITTSDRFGLMTVKMIYSPLCMYNADGINWFLATSVDTSDDNTEYTFHLRDDVKLSLIHI